MRSWMVWGLAVATLVTVVACEVEDPPTEVSVDNRSADLATVTLSDASGGSVAFGEVASATSTAYLDVPFVALRQVTVEVEGIAQGGSVDLSAGFQHTLTLSDDAPPVILVIEPPTGGRDGGGTPAPGNAGW